MKRVLECISQSFEKGYRIDQSFEEGCRMDQLFEVGHRMDQLECDNNKNKEKNEPLNPNKMCQAAL